MPQTCSVCKSKRLPEIDRELVNGKSYRDVAGQYRLSKTAVARHKQAHLPNKLVLAKERENVLSADRLLAEMAELKDKLRAGLEQAERAENPAAFVSFARELRQSVETYFNMVQAIAERQPMGLMDYGAMLRDMSQIFQPIFNRLTIEELEQLADALHKREGLKVLKPP